MQQILLLPQVGKACVLCNWTATFYSLPELSPIFTQVRNCNWIGGVDLNEMQAQQQQDSSGKGGGAASVTILLSLNRKIQVVRIGDDARRLKQIDFAGSIISVRRDSIACVADSKSYALLELDRQLKIPLMTISSLEDATPADVLGQAQAIGGGGGGGGISRSASTATPGRPQLSTPEPPHGHTRSTSLGGLISGTITRRQDVKPRPEADNDLMQEPSTPPPNTRPGSARPSGEFTRGQAQQQSQTAPRPPDKDTAPSSTPSAATASTASAGPTSTASAASGSTGSVGPGSTASAAEVATSQAQAPPRQSTPLPGPPAPILKPLIVSPTADEFLLVTGAGPSDPGIGMFVNLDGDPTRPTIEFERYPKDIVVDGGGAVDLSSSMSGSTSKLLGDGEDGYVLASMTRDVKDGGKTRPRQGIEIQRWDLNVGEGEPTKHWLEPDVPVDKPMGIRSLVGGNETHFHELVERLSQRRFDPFAVRARNRQPTAEETKESQAQESGPVPQGWEEKRNREEEEFARRLARATARLAVWSGNRIWWALRNPLLMQLEAGLDGPNGSADASGSASVESSSSASRTLQGRRELFTVLNSFRGRDARSELEFLTFSYIRQKAGMLLFTSFLHSARNPFAEPELNAMEEVLIEGGLDPRVVLSLTAALRDEVVVGRTGIWIYGGVKEAAEAYIGSDKFGREDRTIGALSPSILYYIKRFLTAWRRKKGFGSVADESDVFRTVDAALLAVLLELDKSSPPGLARSGTLRAELYDLVDHGVDCFGRAVALLESYHRLFVLSRLYQSRKMAAEVLATWRRIIEGERDDGGELGAGADAEQRVREYLTKVSSQQVVQEYGVWLARRNPRLGVKVFAEDKGRAPPFQPAQVVAILRAEAPDAVKYYLEHLVFAKGHAQYVDELINHYLDVVVGALLTSHETRSATVATYEAYRALRAPKPTYRHFLTDNAPPGDDVWQARLRLLQLLGGPHDYDAAAIRKRIVESLPPATTGQEDAESDGTVTPALPLLVPEIIILDGRERRHEDALRLLVHGLGDYDTAVAYCLRGGSSIYAPLGVGSLSSSTTTSSSSSKQQPQRRDSFMPPDRDTQARLFHSLLGEFLSLRDVSDRVEQTAALLEGFGAWFDVADVLARVPDSWSVDVLSGFLISAFRALLRQRRESDVRRALATAENVRVGYERVVAITAQGGRVETGN